MNHKFHKVLMDKNNGQSRTKDCPTYPNSNNFRIVSHYGERDWSPYLSLEEATERFENLPQRPDGYFLLVEG